MREQLISAGALSYEVESEHENDEQEDEEVLNKTMVIQNKRLKYGRKYFNSGLNPVISHILVSKP